LRHRRLQGSGFRVQAARSELGGQRSELGKLI
jgi:hypothetical protein